jgi:hypothetical protein
VVVVVRLGSPGFSSSRPRAKISKPQPSPR